MMAVYMEQYEDILEKMRQSKQIVNYKVTPPRKVLWRDLYRDRDERIQAIMLYRRTRRVTWDRLSLFEYVEFGHLLKMHLYGINDDLDGYLELDTPHGKYYYDFILQPVKPLEYIQLSFEVHKEGATFSELETT